MATKKEKRRPNPVPVMAAEVDARYKIATPLRSLMNRVFPDHWSFLLGEIAVFSFVVLLITGVFLTIFFEPSMQPVAYDGPYVALRGTEVSKAYESVLDISFEVRGGLFVRQMHHWAALLFMASLILHMLRKFFTGAFRRPREANWVIGVLLFVLAFLEGWSGYGLPDDGLSGTGLRIAHAIMLSIPVAGTWITASLFGGEYPGSVIIERLNVLHSFLLPGLVLAVAGLSALLSMRQRPAQFPGPLRTENNVVGERLFPRVLMKRAGLFSIVFAVVALIAGVLQINPVWLYGPSSGSDAASSSQPDWYVMFLDGLLRIFPAWQITIPIGDGYSIPPVFWPGVVVFGGMLTLTAAYPYIERRLRRDTSWHNLLERPRDAPERTGVGAMAVTFYLVAAVSGINDIIADKFHISVNAMVLGGRIALVLGPALAYFITVRICLGLQQHDRQVLAHGVETGIIRRLPDGGFAEVHQHLSTEPLPYSGWAVPKKMNRVGALAPATKGFFFPIERPRAGSEPSQADEPQPDLERQL
ncbi:cytochrome bc1 complex cytochrome b subunit [Paractinoplanes maris]|uniref:cytochrome bc1 complex cytochrome b subunit n=1 Tax=Paractinoplanes maris TaxID=1734446 RepID=UPI003F690E19